MATFAAFRPSDEDVFYVHGFVLSVVACAIGTDKKEVPFLGANQASIFPVYRLFQVALVLRQFQK